MAGNASTCFEQYVLIIRRSKLYFTASGIITPVGGRDGRWPGRPPAGVMRSDAVKYNFDLLMMSKYCSKHVEAYNKIIKEEFVH